MQKHVLITGATGLIGKALTQTLLEENFTVSHLSREPGNNPLVKTYLWNVADGSIDENCLIGVDTIIHLAGASVAGKRWSEERKQEIIDSRIKSIQLIYGLVKRIPNQVKAVISASAVGYYGDRGDEWLTEKDSPGTDFLSQCCVLWEQAVNEGEALGLRTVKLRTGVVLAKTAGALPALAAPIKLGLGAALGTGKQWIPWVHLDDAIGMYLFALNDEMVSGVYDMAAPNPITNKDLTAAVAKQLRKPYWLPNVPAFALKLLMGEMSTIILASDRVSARKIEKSGFTFKYRVIEKALADIYG